MVIVVTKSFKKNILRTIRGSLGRYIAILLIVMLGVGFVAGLRMTKPVMIGIEKQYLEENKMFDLRLVSTIGFDAEDVKAAGSCNHVVDAEGSITQDVATMMKGHEEVLRAQMLTKGVNTPVLKGGRMPKAANECLLDYDIFGTTVIGQTIEVKAYNSEETRDFFAYDSYTVVGVARSPLYFSADRGTTNLGKGTLSGFMLLPEEGFDSEYFTELYILTDQTMELYSTEYKDFIKTLSDAVEPAVKTSLQTRYDDLINEGKQKISDAEEELSTKKADGQKELDDAKEELEDARIEILDAEQQLWDAKDELDSGKEQLDESKVLLDSAKEKLEKGAKEMDPKASSLEGAYETAMAQWEKGQNELNEKTKEAQTELDAAKAKLDAGQAQYESGMKEVTEGYNQYEQGLSDFQQQKAQYEAVKPMLPPEQQQATERQLAEAEATLSATKQTLDSSLTQLETAKETLDAGREEYEQGVATLQKEKEAGQATLDSAKAKLVTFKAGLLEYRKGFAKYEQGVKEYEAGLSEYEDGLVEFQNGKQEYEDGKKQYEDGLAEFDEKIADAEKKIADAKKELEDVKEVSLFVLDRETNSGYYMFQSDSDIVGNVAKVFPIFFFLIAALVCSTTMTRMIDDERGQIGILRALGYSRGLVFFKYAIYSGSAAIIGCVAGYFLCGWLFPFVIWTAYQMLYKMDGFLVLYNWPLFGILLLAALLCSVGTTYFACRSEMKSTPARIILPKAPPPGKRILLERVPWIWNRLSFLRKVSMRNIFRFKKRMIMMILGIAGCTALVATAFGIQDSVANICDYQYDEITTYDVSLSYTDPVTKENLVDLGKVQKEDVQSYCALYSGSCDVKANGKTKSALLVASDDLYITDAIDLHLHGEKVTYPTDNSVVVTDKLAQQEKIEVGDTITLSISDTESKTFRVSGIAENYVRSYVYLSGRTYASSFQKEYEPNTVYVKLKEGIDDHAIGAKYADLDGVMAVSLVSDFRANVDKMMESLDYVVWLVLASACGLAFIVLFNLGNINITERVREIATLKVLGFHRFETSQYVFRENMCLCIAGIVVGLPLGKLLHAFVMTQIKVDMVSFVTVITPLSYLLTVLLVLAFAIFSDLVLRRKIDKINMAESLKSVE